MTGKPKSHRALTLAALAAKPPDCKLDGVDKALLAEIAANADQGTGKNSRPGNATLQLAAELGWSATHERIAKYLRHGLIECTQRGDGRGNASVYRLCFENPAFPDRLPNGEWLIAEPSGETKRQDGSNRPVYRERTADKAKPSGLDRTVSGETAAETIRPDGSNHMAAEAKPYGEDAKPYGLDRTTSETHQENTNHPSKACGDKTAADGWLELIYPTMGRPNKRQRQELDKLITEHTLAVVKEAVSERFGGFDGLDHQWQVFLNEFDSLLPLAKEAVWKKSPERQAQIEADIKRQNAELVRQRQARRDDEPTLEEARAQIDAMMRGYPPNSSPEGT